MAWIRLAFGVAALQLRAHALAQTDILGTKVWLDQHLFNMTLKTTHVEHKGRVWMMSDDKAVEQGLQPWPPEALPTLCFLGLGANSIEYLHALAQLFPELQLVLFDADDRWVVRIAEMLGEARWRVALGTVEEFSESAGSERRSCDAISWSVDTPTFSFYRYREIFYTVPYVLALFNMQGCSDTSTDPDVDKYYCEYLYSNFQTTLCGSVGEDKSAEWHNQKMYFPLLESSCGENICMCHAHSDAFIDFHLEQLCRKNQPHRFMGQWGQDEFMMNNIFKNDRRPGSGVYVDVGASHPYHLSNTAYFDMCLGWRGVCMEPNPRSRDVLRGVRTCEVVSACAWANATTLRFANGAELAARTEDETLLPSNPYEMPEGLHIADTYFEARCAPLHDLLLEGVPHALGLEETQEIVASGRKPTIDLLSVDAEGAELEIFGAFPFELWHIRAIVVETSRSTATGMDSLLLPHGYMKVAVLGKDAVYVHHSVAAQLPPQGPILPERINWNEPGSDEDTIDYIRFQRLFGVEGDLDVDVGDQRLLNESEIDRQSARQEAKDKASVAAVMESAADAAVGGVYSDDQQQAMELEWVQAYLREPKVRTAMKLLLTNLPALASYVGTDAELKKKLAELMEVGVINHSGSDVLGRVVKQL